MLISDYLSSNRLICILFFDLTHFKELGQKYKKKSFFFGSNENLKICIRDLLTFSVLVDPIQIFRNSCIDSRISIISTSGTPRGDSTNFVLRFSRFEFCDWTVQWSSRVTLKRDDRIFLSS